MEPWEEFLHITDDMHLESYEPIIHAIFPQHRQKTVSIFQVLERMPVEAALRAGAKSAAKHYLARQSTSAIGRFVATGTVRAVPIIGAAMLVYDIYSIARILSE